MSFKGVTFFAQKVTASDDGVVRRAMLSDGILSGCALSFVGATLSMSAGHLLICGRQIKLSAAQNWPITGAVAGYARLLLTVDLSRSATSEIFDQVVPTVEYASTPDGFAALQQQDLNNGGTVYQYEYCIVALSAGGISSIYKAPMMVSIVLNGPLILTEGVHYGKEFPADATEGYLYGKVVG